ncbi:hypothetical protein GQ55_2G176100 [Panicum hallii var. hallii]|uniref:Uncharacterized protein n=1 Tax=Panicum hallii var. hallii TaxID=1504633 RepID=A0A2T7EQ75_9POAL|nr:hypothetical protein GQ55_2G176100 [Panicum hallii var. hallii]
MGEGRSADSIPEPLSGEVLKQGVVDAFQLLENSENNQQYDSFACFSVYQLSILFFFNCDAATGEQRCGTGRSGVQKREREDRAATEKTEKWSGAGQVPKMNSLGADRVHISQYARKQMQYRRNTRRIAYLARI